MRNGQAIPRHLVFTLEDGDIVVQRGANIVELLESQEQRTFTDGDYDHAATDEELQNLLERHIIANYDQLTVWLPPLAIGIELFYYFLDTKLPPITLKMVRLLLQTAHLDDRYMAKNRMGRVAIMDAGGDPFSRLVDAEAALTLVKTALGEHLVDLSIERIKVNPRADETQITNSINVDLIHETPLTTMSDRTVLVVVNEKDTMDQMQAILETLGVQIRQAFSGEDALEILMDEEPDLLVVDLLLPDLHGYEVIAKVRRDPLTANTPIVVLSPLNSEADVVFALHVARVDEYLVMPISGNVLRNRVIHLLNQLN